MVVGESEVEATLRIGPRGFPDVLESNAGTVPDGPALTYRGAVTTHRELRDRAHAVAGAFRSLGLGKGDRVAVKLYNRPELLELLFGAALSGVIMVPLNYRLAESELMRILDEVEPSVLFLTSEFKESATGSAALARPPRLVYVGSEPIAGAASYEQLLAEAGPAPEESQGSPDDLLSIMYTGGTTGGSKGVMQSHGGWVSAVESEVAGVRFGQETMLAAMPLFHVGMVHPLCVLSLGGHVILHERVVLEDILDTIERDRVTMTVLLPTSVGDIERLLQERPRDVSSLRHLLYGAAPMPLTTVARAIGSFGAVLTGVYGMTEASGTVATLGKSDHQREMSSGQEARLQSVGRPLPGISAECWDEDGRPLPANEVGEIVLRGGGVMKGYWRRPDMTAEALRDGCLRTGDLGRIDEDGYIFLVDRKSNMIITGGENVYPKEVEDVLVGHPDVLEVAVLGVPDEKWGEAVSALVVPRPGCELSEGDILEYGREHLTGYKRPRAIRFADALPKTTVGKVDRRALADLFVAPIRSSAESEEA
jgi:acyl-CoA synthetase (AMP-forming)/AMP-acid ligase II